MRPHSNAACLDNASLRIGQKLTYFSELSPSARPNYSLNGYWTACHAFLGIVMRRVTASNTQGFPKTPYYPKSQYLYFIKAKFN